jgi:hypothetical protein
VIRSFLFLLLLWTVAVAGAERKTAPALLQPPVDFNHPPREYVEYHLHGWQVFVEKELAETAPSRCSNALARLEAKLGEAAALLPAPAVVGLRKLRVFLMHGPSAKGGGRSNGLEYFRADAPRHHPWLDPRMGPSIVIFNAENYLKLSEFWALKALVHEFGHAQHLQHWPEDHADIYDTWAAAKKAGLYQTVRTQDQGTHNPNYALQNHLEYFAELTATYFAGNNYFPRDRASLRTYDPDGLALIERCWALPERNPGSARPTPVPPTP